MLKKILNIFAWMLGIAVFLGILFILYHLYNLKDNKANVIRDAEVIMENVKYQYLKDTLNNDDDINRCYDISDYVYLNDGLIGKKKNNYHGSVLIGHINDDNEFIKIWISDGETYATGFKNKVEAEKSSEVAQNDCYMSK